MGSRLDTDPVGREFAADAVGRRSVPPPGSREEETPTQREEVTYLGSHSQWEAEAG